MQGDGKLDGAETRGQVAAHLTHRLDQIAPQFFGERTELASLEGAKVGRRLDRLEKAALPFVSHFRSLLERRKPGMQRLPNG